MKSYEKWCADNGRRWMGCKNFEEFKRNADDYAAWLQAELDKNKTATVEATNHLTNGEE